MNMLYDQDCPPVWLLKERDALRDEVARLRGALQFISTMQLPHNAEELLSERMRNAARAALEP